jgi:mono/diheme cytochrome c family protein
MPSVRAVGVAAFAVAMLGCEPRSDQTATVNPSGGDSATPPVVSMSPVPAAATPPAVPSVIAAKANVVVNGATVFATACLSCHQANGEGVPDKYPPLAGSEWVTGSEERMLRIVISGLTGEVEVQGEMFSGVMPGWGPTLSNAEIAAVATYVRSQWGNAAPAVDTATVARVRAASATRTTPWTVAELRRH